jgi:hypothetical protein
MILLLPSWAYYPLACFPDRIVKTPSEDWKDFDGLNEQALVLIVRQEVQRRLGMHCETTEKRR